MVNNVRTQQSRGLGKPFPLPAPHEGLNTRESYASLRPTEARILENWLPDEGSVRVRPGYTQHQEISGATSVPTMMQFKGAASQKLIAAAAGEIYDVSGTPSALTTASYSVDAWSYENYNNRLIAVNGTDTPWSYDGSTVGATGFTGPTIANLETIKQVRNRLWFTLEDSPVVYYGPIQGITGALTSFDLGQVAAGGKCIAINSWSRDAGDGSDDFIVFAMSTGQIIVYQGDPATTFSLVGKYDAPALVERNATLKIGGECILMTVSGAIPLSRVLSGSGEENPYALDKLGNWGKIAPGWREDYQRYRSNSGFNSFFFDGIAYFNFPTGTNATKQYVLNTRTSAWTTYTGMPIASIADYAGGLYFGSSSGSYVYLHGTGSDNGGEIITLARQGASYPLGGTRSGIYKTFRPNIDVNGPASFQFTLDTDFQDKPFGNIYDLNTSVAGADWGDDWGTDWASDAQTIRSWRAARGKGRAVAVALRTRSTASDVKWFASDVRGAVGGQL